MKVYRIITQEELMQGLNSNYFAAKWSCYAKNSGWAKINHCGCCNTFNDQQNKNLHFFKYSIDAVQYLSCDKNDFFNYSDYTNHYFCIFNIPDELLDKGYGFYPNKVAPEYVSNGKIKSEYLIGYTNLKNEMFLEMFSDIDNAIYWYSTVGKAAAMILDSGFIAKPVCGSRTQGGFINSFKNWIECAGGMFLDNENVNRLIEYCTKKNIQAYEETGILNEKDYLHGILHRKYIQGLNYDEINAIFSDIECKYYKKRDNNDEPLGCSPNETIILIKKIIRRSD